MIYLAVVCFGFAAMVAQILLLRELFVVFYGNELSAGVMLASWLFWVSVGSFSVNRLKSQKRFVSLFNILLLSVSIIIPLSIYAVRNIKNLLGVLPGEIIGISPMVLSSFAVLAPACVVFGALFTVSCALLSGENKKSPEEAGKVYLLEAIGAVAGGLAFNFIFVYIFNPIQIGLFCGALNVGAVLLLADRKKAALIWRAACVFMALIIYLFVFKAEAMDFRLRQMQWKKFDLVAVKDSPFGNIALTRLRSQSNLFENGLLVASTNDPLTAEESVHYALLEHPAPRKVLLIGGSLTGALDEALKHPVEKVDCVELDPAMIKTAKDNYPKEALKALNEPRVALHYVDGRLFVKKLAAEKIAKYDAVILTLPNPFTVQLNRFYSREFYGEVKNILAEDGIFSFSVTSSENYIGEELSKFLGCIYLTLGKEFSDIKIIPGDNDIFLASRSSGILTYDYRILAQRIEDRGLLLKYVNRYYLPDKFNAQRIEYLESSLKSAKPSKINRDFRPIGYFYDMVLWSARVNSQSKAFFEWLARFNPLAIALVFPVLFSTFILLKQKLRRSENFPVVVSIGTTGFSAMLLEIVLIVGFQAIYGYVYYKIGLLFAAFMAGLAAGSAVSVKILKKRLEVLKIYRMTQSLLYCYCFMLALLFSYFEIFSTGRNLQTFTVEALFVSLIAILGVMAGIQFPLANKLYSEEGKNSGKTAGLLYGADLLGACAGALITSAILIPVIGITYSCVLTGLMNLPVLILLFAKR